MLKDIPSEGDTYHGKHIPGGIAIGYSAMGMLMNKKIWGDDAETFRPERFLEGPEDEVQARNSTVEYAFGYGRWRCLGRNIAQMELNKAVTEVSYLPNYHALWAVGRLLMNDFYRLSARLTSRQCTRPSLSRTSTQAFRFNGICG